MPYARADGADLRPKFEKGRVTLYRQVMALDQVMTMPGGQEMKIPMKTESGISLRVAEVAEDGSAKVELSMLFLKLDSEMPHMQLQLDTRDPESLAKTPMGRVLPGLLNKPVTLSVSASGELTDVEGFDRITADLGPARQFVEGIFSEEAVKQMPLYQTAKAKHPTDAGDTWEDEFEIALPMNMGTLQVRTQYTLGTIDAKAKLAAIPAVMTTTLKAPTTQAQQPAGMGLTNVDGKSTGVVRWDLDAGELIGSTMEGQMVMEMAMGGPQKITQKTEVVLERVDRKALELPAQPPSTQAAERGESPATE
jgi:hypothetical protein